MGYVAICILGGYYAARSYKVGDIQAFIQYVRQFTQPILNWELSNILQQTAASAERVFEFLDEEEEVQDAVDSIKPGKIDGKVEFKKCSFRIQ